MPALSSKQVLWQTLLTVICVGMACSDSGKPEKDITFIATAYAIQGETASGEQTRAGIVAVDPSVVPLGSRVRITGAGEYSGIYRAEDTGRKIKGRRIDIFMERREEAKEFGRRRVEVAILNSPESAAADDAE